MTKAEMIIAVAEKAGMTKKDAEKAVSAVDNYAADFRCAGIKFNIVCVA